MGHTRLLVQGQGVDLSRASQILAWAQRGGGVQLATATQTGGTIALEPISQSQPLSVTAALF